MPRWLALCFQDRCSPLIGQFSYLHDHVIVIITIIIVFIMYVISYILFTGTFYKHFSEGTFIERV